MKGKRDEQSDDSGPTKKQHLHRQPFARDKSIFCEKDDTSFKLMMLMTL